MKILRITLLLIGLLSPGFWGLNPLRKHLDPRYVGVWVGDTLREDGQLKKWSQTRFEDGGFETRFEYHLEGKLANTHYRYGEWWVIGDLYHEIMQPGELRFVYRVEWISEDCLRMTSVERDRRGDEYEGYTFDECREDVLLEEIDCLIANRHSCLKDPEVFEVFQLRIGLLTLNLHYAGLGVPHFAWKISSVPRGSDRRASVVVCWRRG
ncbi:MAG: hypothetical protein AAF546_08980 [Verrucomicrobiota bacterium]